MSKINFDTDEIKRLLVTCTELNMPSEVQHRAMTYALGRIEELEKLENLVKQYIQKHNITCSECIWLMDKPRVDAIVLADELCKLVLKNKEKQLYG